MAIGSEPPIGESFSRLPIKNGMLDMDAYDKWATWFADRIDQDGLLFDEAKVVLTKWYKGQPRAKVARRDSKMQENFTTVYITNEDYQNESKRSFHESFMRKRVHPDADEVSMEWEQRPNGWWRGTLTSKRRSDLDTLGLLYKYAGYDKLKLEAAVEIEKWRKIAKDLYVVGCHSPDCAAQDGLDCDCTYHIAQAAYEEAAND